MDTSICQTCLNKDRRLVPQAPLRELFQEINLMEIMKTEGGICWECHHMLKRFTKFKGQVRKAQDMLFYYVEGENIKSLSKLATKTKKDYDFEFIFAPDPLTNVSKVKIELKDETLISDDDSIYCDGDGKHTVDIIDEKIEIDDESDNDDNIDTVTSNNINLIITKIPVLETENKKITTKIDTANVNIVTNHKRRGKVKKPHSVEEDDKKKVKEKFSKIVFSVEEMEKRREEKRNHHNYKKIPNKCHTCVLGFLRKDKYEAHMEEKHGEKAGKFTCDVCERRFPNKGCIERHIRKHFVCYRCRLCKYETLEPWSAFNHCRNKHRTDTPDRIHCPKCEWVATNPEDMADHMQEKHSLQCKQCGEKFKQLNTLRKHEKRIHGVKREFKCDLCVKAFVSKSRLESHLARHGAARARELAYCAQCGVQYKSLYTYRSHLRNNVTHATAQFSCPECNKTFLSKRYMNTHYNFYHLRKSKFKCEICNKLFISDWRLKNHKQTNHGLTRPRNHVCNVCGKKFFSKALLAGHQLTHSEQRRYMCAGCGDTFKQPAALYTHARLVHRPPPPTQPRPAT